MSRKDHSEYDHESLREEREYGFYWYSGVWRVLRPILVGLGALLLVFGLLSGLWSKLNEAFISPIDPTDASAHAFTVESGSSLTRVSNALEAQGLIKNRSVFKYYCDFAGMGQKIQAGDYLIGKNMSMLEIAQLLTTGDGKPMTMNITVIPGWDVETIAAMLVEKGALNGADAFLALCKSGAGVEDYYFVRDALSDKDAGKRKYLLEGYLSPNTYEIYTSSEPLAILKKLLDQTDKVFGYVWQERAAELGISMDDALTLASLIEKEAKSADFKNVSAVFHNRLKAGMPLQSDVTIHYLLSERRMALRNDDLAIDSPYNTYKYKGLPPGPICSPSAAAIEAALYPNEAFVAEKYLYFCSKDPDTGELHFSKTLEEHERAVKIYAPLWEAYDKERGL